MARKKSSSRRAKKKQPRTQLSARTKAEITEFPPSVPGASAVPRVGDFRRAARDASWSVHESLKDSDPAPVHPLGGSREGRAPTDPAQRLDWHKVLQVPPRNLHLFELAERGGLLSEEALRLRPVSGPEGKAPKPRARKRAAKPVRKRKKR